jgi:hypothetical protein
VSAAAAATPRVRVQEAPFDPGAESAALTAGREDVGGVASFVGLCRADDGLAALVLEHYPGMTERAIAGIAAEACRAGRFPAAPWSTASGGCGRGSRSCWCSPPRRTGRRRWKAAPS